jgi:hypothetical protein
MSNHVLHDSHFIEEGLGMKKLLLVLVVLIGVSGAAFAQDWAASYNEPGDFNIYASAGYWWGVDLNVAAEYMIGEFSLGPIPFDWGIMARGGMEFWSGYLEWGAGALATLHMGLSWNVEFSIALGACYSSYSLHPFSFAYGAIARYWFSKSLAVIAEEGYLGFSYWGVGLELKI